MENPLASILARGLKFLLRNTDHLAMECPKCRSTQLMIRYKKGFERVRSFFTGLRQYLCRDCGEKFRAPDRRAVPREDLPQSVRDAA
jgi:transposase-like protein